MSNDDHQNRDVRQRIADFIQADLQAPSKLITEEDARTLRSAGGRLDQLLAEVAQKARSKQPTEEDLGILKAAVRHFDRLLTGIVSK